MLESAVHLFSQSCSFSVSSHPESLRLVPKTLVANPSLGGIPNGSGQHHRTRILDVELWHCLSNASQFSSSAGAGTSYSSTAPWVLLKTVDHTNFCQCHSYLVDPIGFARARGLRRGDSCSIPLRRGDPKLRPVLGLLASLVAKAPGC